MEDSLDQEEMWTELLPRLRRYVMARQWRLDFLLAHLQLEPQAGLMTIGHWLTNARQPTGDKLVKLGYVLHTFGFHMPGIGKLDANVRFAGQLFAFDAVHYRDILRDLFDLHEARPQALYQILRGDRTPKSIFDARPTYTPRLAQRIKEAVALEQEVTRAPTAITQVIYTA